MGSVDVFASIVKMFSALAVILGLMIGATYGLKKLLNRTGTGLSLSDEGLVRIVSTRYLGPKSSILVMEVLGRVMVVGISNNQMTLLATIAEPGVLEKIGAAGQGRRSSLLADRIMNPARWVSGLSGKGKKDHE